MNSKLLLDYVYQVTKEFLIKMHPKAKLPIPELPRHAPHDSIENSIDFNNLRNQ